MIMELFVLTNSILKDRTAGKEIIMKLFVLNCSILKDRTACKEMIFVLTNSELAMLNSMT